MQNGYRSKSEHDKFLSHFVHEKFRLNSIPVDTGPCNDFRKHAYELIPPNNYVLIHYHGDEKAAILFAHRNNKNIEQVFIRTAHPQLKR